MDAQLAERFRGAWIVQVHHALTRRSSQGELQLPVLRGHLSSEQRRGARDVALACSRSSTAGSVTPKRDDRGVTKRAASNPAAYAAATTCAAVHTCAVICGSIIPSNAPPTSAFRGVLEQICFGESSIVWWQAWASEDALAPSF